MTSLTAATFMFLAVTVASAAEPREEAGVGSNPGNLRMFSYVAPDLKTPAMIVVLHGCKQKAATFARDAGWIDLADGAKVALLLPEQKGLHPYFYDRTWGSAMGLLARRQQSKRLFQLV